MVPFYLSSKTIIDSISKPLLYRSRAPCDVQTRRISYFYSYTWLQRPISWAGRIDPWSWSRSCTGILGCRTPQVIFQHWLRNMVIHKDQLYLELCRAMFWQKMPREDIHQVEIFKELRDPMACEKKSRNSLVVGSNTRILGSSWYSGRLMWYQSVSTTSWVCEVKDGSCMSYTAYIESNLEEFNEIHRFV